MGSLGGEGQPQRQGTATVVMLGRKGCERRGGKEERESEGRERGGGLKIKIKNGIKKGSGSSKIKVVAEKQKRELKWEFWGVAQRFWGACVATPCKTGCAVRDWGQVRQRELMFASVSRERCRDWLGERILKFGVEISN